MMTKYILYLVLSVLPLSISAHSAKADCNCTDLDFETVTTTLTAQAWQAADGTLWSFLADGHAIASVQGQEKPTIAKWEWTRSDNCWRLSVRSSQGQKYFQIPLTAASDMMPNLSLTVLQKSKSASQLDGFVRQIEGQWRASLGRDAGIMNINLYQKGLFDREHNNASGSQTDAGYWALSPDQRFLILFSKQDTKVSMMRIPYVELDEMVLESVTDQSSWFFNRL